MERNGHLCQGIRGSVSQRLFQGIITARIAIWKRIQWSTKCEKC